MPAHALPHVQVLQEAKAIDASKAAGNDTGPLCGLPFAVKDNIDVVGYPTVAGTPGLAGKQHLPIFAQQTRASVHVCIKKLFLLVCLVSTLQVVLPGVVHLLV